MENINNIPKEKLQFANKNNLGHDQKFDTKPVSYFHDAFRRFSKNKGAVVAAVIIILLVLFALIAPFCTPYAVDYEDARFANTMPKLKLFENTSFWDGCKEKEVGKITFVYDYAIGLESGHKAVKNNEFTIGDDGMYRYRWDTYYSKGCDKYMTISNDEYQKIQRYQDETGIQVIYPTVRLSDRPQTAQDRNDANYYYKTTTKKNKTIPVYEKDGDVPTIIPVYWEYEKAPDTVGMDNYTSKVRIEGENGIQKNGKTYFYAYSRTISDGVEVRANYYEYYIYKHSYDLKDGIEEPYFVFGATGAGKDILTCLSSGARFSFLFAIAVVAVNVVVGAIYGAVAGYYGGKTDLIMERVTDILSAIPTMIVITLLTLHMGSAGGALILFIAFFLTGWIGMAGTTRMQFYRYKNQEYVLASRTLGARDMRVIWKHIFPNALGTIITSIALSIPSMIYSETNLSYLGIINLESGKITSVGTLIAAGQQSLTIAPHVALFPSIFLALLMLCFNLFGNGLRDAFNPSLRGSEG